MKLLIIAMLVAGHLAQGALCMCGPACDDEQTVAEEGAACHCCPDAQAEESGASTEADGCGCQFCDVGEMPQSAVVEADIFEVSGVEILHHVSSKICATVAEKPETVTILARPPGVPAYLVFEVLLS